jgi:thiamine-phosphate pyrophosphorylase
MTAKRISGLYAVTPDLADTPRLLAMVEAALQGGISLLQYRNKAASYALKREQASELLWLCADYDVPFIINDHVLLCVELDADGVHLGIEDGEIASARRLLGPTKLIGASCYNRLELAQAAKSQGADYVAFGACFSSATKPAAIHAPLELFGRCKSEIGLPSVAIGGINASNLAEVIAAGADSAALITAIFGSTGDIVSKTATLARMFQQNRE